MEKNADKIVLSAMWSAGCGSHGGCGAEIYVKDGKVVCVEGDTNHPHNQGRLCPKGLAIPQYMYHPDRVTTPLKRVGARGEGKWEPISWDEAYGTIETRLKDIRDKYGAESVIFCQGTGRDIGGPITFLMYAYGSPNWVQVGLAGHACYTPRLGAMFATQGSYCVLDASQFLEERYESEEWEPPKYIIIWAQNPIAGCHDGFFGHWIIDCMKRGSKLIVIDPRSTWFSSRAEVHLQNRPGTDGAIALGMLNVIINEGIYDKEFVEKWCYGFDELKERVQEYPPEKVEEITWVPADLLRQAARLYANNKPSAIQWGEPVDAMPAGSVVAQAINHLWAITGNVDNPGGNVIAKNSHGVTTYPFSSAELTKLYGEELVKKLNEKRIGANDYPMIKNFRGWVQPDVLIEQLETGKPYKVRGAWIQTSNILGGQAADPRRHYEAMKDLDFIVVVDLFQNPTSMALGDIFLPAVSFCEKESFRSWWQPLCVTQQAVKPVGECKSDWEINLEMAKRLATTPIKYDTVRELINDRLKDGNTDFDTLANKGGWEFPPEGHPTRPYYRHEKGLLRQDGQPGFDTPTGKVELYSKRYEEWGLDPLPYYEEPAESEVSTPDVAKEYPLILTTGRRSPVFFHSEHRMIPWLRELDPDPVVEIHPEAAEDAGIANGEWVYVENKRGRVKFRAKVTATAHPRVVTCPHGWWLPETDGKAPNLFSTWDHNINNLTSMGNQAKSGFGGTDYRSCQCRVVKIKD
ncbi:MAG: molybdopterin-dependent oxidoreductase [Dehalococcoidia bacterium]|jgi:anaerobic selenocysteine-containing dehydrogenase